MTGYLLFCSCFAHPIAPKSSLQALTVLKPKRLASVAPFESTTYSPLSRYLPTCCGRELGGGGIIAHVAAHHHPMMLGRFRRKRGDSVGLVDGVNQQLHALVGSPGIFDLHADMRRSIAQGLLERLGGGVPAPPLWRVCAVAVDAELGVEFRIRVLDRRTFGTVSTGVVLDVVPQVRLRRIDREPLQEHVSDGRATIVRGVLRHPLNRQDLLNARHDRPRC